MGHATPEFRGWGVYVVDAAYTMSTCGNKRLLLYQEIALLRFLVGHGFKPLLSRNEATAAEWKKLTTQADQRSDRIVDELLSRRR